MSEPTPQERRARGLARMSEVYGFEVSDGPGDQFAHTADQLFGEVWTREGLSDRDRRLLLFGALGAAGLDDVVGLQAGAALANGEVDADQLREIALFLTYYIGWPLGTKVEFAVGKAISDHRRKLRDAEKKDS
ncbi:carboxymuconolactone decarboxylase family protein [Williamsia sp. SKLECPSW1]